MVDYTPTELLAVVLFHALFPYALIPISLSLDAISERISSVFGTRFVFINLDEFQKSISATRDILIRPI